MPFFHDLTTELGLQRAADATRKAITTSIALAPYQSNIASLASQIASRHPHLTPGITLSLANAGYGPHDSITESASALAAARKVNKGSGWHSIGDTVNPSHPFGSISIPGIHFPEAIGTTLSKAAHAINVSLDAVGDAITAPAKPALRIIGATALSIPQLADAAVRRVATNSPDNSFTNELLETTLGQSVKSAASGKGLALGHGYFPAGPAAEQAAKSSAQTQSLTYADHPFFSLHDDPNKPASPHVGTTGRNIAKTIIEPGTPLFSAVSGLIDAAKTIVLDPVSAAGKAVGKSNEVRRSFSAEDLGKSTFQVGTKVDPFVDPEAYHAQQILIQGHRNTIDGLAAENWLTQHPVGRAVVDSYAANPNAYDIWTKSGGMNGNMTPGLASSLSAANTPEAVREVLSPALGIDLLNKPVVSRVGLATKELGIRDRLDGIRMFNNVPSFSAIDLEDAQQSAKELVLNLRNGKAPQELIESSFNEMAAAATPLERANILHNALNIDLPRHIVATDLTGPLGSLERNFARLRSAFDDDAAWSQITRDQIARKQPIMGVLADGEEHALRSPYHDAEALNRQFVPPDIRTIRRVTSTYGRLLVLSHAEVPLAALDHIQDLWKGANIARISTMLRITGQSQVQMTARGLDSPYRHLLDYIAEASGRKLGTNILGEELSANAVAGFTDDARRVATTSWANDIRQAQREVIPFYSDRFATALADDIYDLHTDPLARRIAGHESITADPVSEAKSWLASDDAAAIKYRDDNGITADTVSSYIQNLSNRIKAKTLSQDSLMSAIRDGEFGTSTSVRFTTAKGSTYEVASDGTTIRNKAARPEHPGDSGPQPKSARTVYLTEQNANRLATPQGEWYFVEHDGKLTLVSRTAKDKPLGAAQSQRNVSFSQKPAKGLIPVELWNPRSVQSTEGFSKVHFGNPITEISGGASPIYTQSDQGVRRLSPGFKNHINSLVEKGLTPDETIGEILTPVDLARENLADRAVRKWMDKVLIGPINHWVTNPALRQYYYDELAKVLPLMSEEAQTAALKASADAGLRTAKVKELAAVAAKRSGDLNIEEANLLTTSRASDKLHATLYDMHDRKQVMDITRLLFPFGQAWAQQLKEWASLLKDRPNIIPRAETLIHGAEGSGFFFVDPRTIEYDENGNPIPGTGKESFAYPGSAFVSKFLTGAPFALTSPVTSLNMFSSNPLMPGFGPIAQTLVGHIVPDKPEFIELKKMVAPFGTPDSITDYLPSYMGKLRTALFSDPASDRAFANTVWDTAKYLASTGQYDIHSVDGQIKLEDAARSMAKKLYLFRGIAQFALPSSPTPQDVVKDESGNSILTFAMAQEYYSLVDDDKLNHTNLAVSRFIDQFGTKNILGMQAITTGAQPLNTNGFMWVLDHPDIARKYSDTYSYFAPPGGGRSQQAYDMLFKNGKRKILSVSDALQAANARVASMIYDNLKEQLGPKRTPAQSQWLADRKQLLIDKYPGWNPDYVGTKTPERIRELERAAADPKLSTNPITPALQAYFHFRDQAETAAGITGWKTANSTKTTRDWLRAKADAITARVPEFKSVYEDLLSRELKDDG